MEMQNGIILIMGSRKYEFSILHIVVQFINDIFGLMSDKIQDCFLRDTKPLCADFELGAFSGSCCSPLGLLS